MTPLDGKVHGVLISNNTGQVIPPDEYVVFRVHDKQLLDTLYHYNAMSIKLKEEGLVEQEQIDAMCRLIDRVSAWQRANPDRMKWPDSKPGECH